jgi:hypothetical protein
MIAVRPVRTVADMTATTQTSAPGAPAPGAAALVPLAAAGAVVALAAGTYARVHEPTYQGITTFGFRAVLPMKAWFTTVAFALVLVQLYSALRMWDRIRIPRRRPAWLATAHRWTGTLAFLFTLPVAYHCLWSLGFDDTTVRTTVHGIAGCAFYGAFTTKMLALRSSRLPGWALPVVGGGLVALLTVLWLSSSLWYFTNVGFPGT